MDDQKFLSADPNANWKNIFLEKIQSRLNAVWPATEADSGSSFLLALSLLIVPIRWDVMVKVVIVGDSSVGKVLLLFGTLMLNIFTPDFLFESSPRTSVEQFIQSYYWS